jgi:hypothetical protein
VYHRYSRSGSLKRTVVIASIVVCVILVIALSLSTFLSLTDTAQNSTKNPGQTPTPASQLADASPLIFGSNIDLLANNSQLRKSEETRTALATMHLHIMRVLINNDADDTSVRQAAQYVKNLDATLLVVLQGPTLANAQQNFQRIVRIVSQVFDQKAVYFEIGNEEDLMGTSVDHYVEIWNALVPGLKQIASWANFVGPVTYHYDQQYLMSFLQKAQPRPNAVSWHEYSCDSSQSEKQCLDNIQKWGEHISAARDAMAKTLNTILPVMITEWNYAANARLDDGKAGNAEFMRTWTMQALQILANNSVFAAMQFSAANSPAPLIDANNALTTQGTVLKTSYEQYSSVAQNLQATRTPEDDSNDPSATTVPTTDESTPTTTDETTPTATAPSASTPTKTPTATPTRTPTPTPTPIPCSSHNWYLHPYGGTTGSTHLFTSGHCGGKILMTLTRVPAYMTQLRVCLVGGACGSWKDYAGVNVWLTMYTGLAAGKEFYLQARDVNGGGSYVVYGTVKY